MRILEVDTEVRLETKYAVIFSSYLLACLKNTMEFFYKFCFYEIIVPVQCTSAKWTLAVHQVFSSYVCCPQNLFKAPEISESDE